MTGWRGAAASLGVLSISLILAVPAAAGELLGVGQIPGFDRGTGARAVSGDGLVVVGSARSTDFGSVGYRWTREGGIETLPYISPGPGEQLAPEAVSYDGSVIAGDGDSEAEPHAEGEAFRWVEGSGTTGLGGLPGGTTPRFGGLSLSTDVSADGSVVVGHAYFPDAGGFETVASRWTPAGGLESLGTLMTDTGVLASSSASAASGAR